MFTHPDNRKDDHPGYVTRRDGYPVRIYAVDGGDKETFIHGAYKNGCGAWISEWWYVDGLSRKGMDVIDAPPAKKTVWLNVYKNDPTWYPYNNKKEADGAMDVAYRTECIEVTYTPGEGL